MARESLSDKVQYEEKSYGVELHRDEADESIKLTNHELEELSERLHG